MIDRAHRLTDKSLEQIERELKQLYTELYAEIKKKSNAILSKIETNPNMTPDERYRAYQKYGRIEALENQIAESLKNVNTEAVRIINGKMVDVYQINYNMTAQSLGGVFPTISKSTISGILRGQVTPFKKMSYDGLKDIGAIRTQLTRELTTGILQGESIPQLARRVREVTEKKLSDAVRIARTETTRVESSARIDVGNQGKKLGFEMEKTWVSTSDDRTRPEHNEADGQTVPLDKPFIVGGEELMQPGDEAGSAWNTINCRCTVKLGVKSKGE